MRRAAAEMRKLAVEVVGTTMVVAGSYLAKKILESVPEPAPEPGTPQSSTTPEHPVHHPHGGSRRAA
jgi:hypothetical protein